MPTAAAVSAAATAAAPASLLTAAAVVTAPVTIVTLIAPALTARLRRLAVAAPLSTQAQRTHSKHDLTIQKQQLPVSKLKESENDVYDSIEHEVKAQR